MADKYVRSIYLDGEKYLVQDQAATLELGDLSNTVAKHTSQIKDLQDLLDPCAAGMFDLFRYVADKRGVPRPNVTASNVTQSEFSAAYSKYNTYPGEYTGFYIPPGSYTNVRFNPSQHANMGVIKIYGYGAEIPAMYTGLSVLSNAYIYGLTLTGTSGALFCSGTDKTEGIRFIDCTLNLQGYRIGGCTKLSDTGAPAIEFVNCVINVTAKTSYIINPTLVRGCTITSNQAQGLFRLGGESGSTSSGGYTIQTPYKAAAVFADNAVALNTGARLIDVLPVKLDVDTTMARPYIVLCNNDIVAMAGSASADYAILQIDTQVYEVDGTLDTNVSAFATRISGNKILCSTGYRLVRLSGVSGASHVDDGTYITDNSIETNGTIPIIVSNAASCIVDISANVITDHNAGQVFGVSDTSSPASTYAVSNILRNCKLDNISAANKSGNIGG